MYEEFHTVVGSERSELLSPVTGWGFLLWTNMRIMEIHGEKKNFFAPYIYILPYVYLQLEHIIYKYM